jgi:LmbE family N-acetylglucosaminyl deacetylase
MILTLLWVVISFLGFGTCLLLWTRRRVYQRELGYNPKQDFETGISSRNATVIPIKLERDGFRMPKLPDDAVSACLPIRLKATFSGTVFDPFVEIVAGNYRDTQFFARDILGLRNLNLSRLLHSGIKEGDRITFRCHRLSFAEQQTEMVVCREKAGPEDRVLVIAPHPDDAELAAFGLYTDTNATIVTLTAGDASNHFHGRNGSIKLSRSQCARLRVKDSIEIPQWAGLPRTKIINLCYPDSHLNSMRAMPLKDFSRNGSDPFDFQGLRQLNSSGLLRDGASCSWDSLIKDLAFVIGEVKPTIIVSPDPWNDPHPDHLATTVVVCEAMRSLQRAEGRFFLTNVHNRWSELYPLGPAGTGVPLPYRDDNGGPESRGFYSHALTDERQMEKYLALEAMHDIRELAVCPPYTFDYLWHRFRTVAGSLVHGLGTPPTSLLRRAVRPDEIFRVMMVEEVLNLHPEQLLKNPADR